MRRTGLLTAAVVLTGVLSVGTDAPASEPKPLLDPNAVVVDARGVARVVLQPEFHSATNLRVQLLEMAVPKLAVHLVAPRVPALRPHPRAPLPPPVLHRLMLMGPEDAVRKGLSILRRLDRPVRAVRVCMTVAEVWGDQYTERGGSFLYDRVTAPDQRRKTLFRSLRIGFEPTEYLRSDVLGLRPYEGHNYNFGSDDFFDDLFEFTLRTLNRRGSASYVARPNLVLNEGETGSVESLRQIPELLVGGRPGDPVVTQRDELVGLKMRIVPTRIGADEAVLDLDVWFRIPEPVTDTGSPVGGITLKERRVQTRVVARDGEAMLLSGLRIRRSNKDEMNPIPFLPPINPVFSTVMRAGRASEIWFVIRVFVHEPRIAPNGPTHHARFQAR